MIIEDIIHGILIGGILMMLAGPGEHGDGAEPAKADVDCGSYVSSSLSQRDRERLCREAIVHKGGTNDDRE